MRIPRVLSPGGTEWETAGKSQLELEKMLTHRADGAERAGRALTLAKLQKVLQDPTRHHQGWRRADAAPDVHEKAEKDTKNAERKRERRGDPEYREAENAKKAGYYLEHKEKEKVYHAAYIAVSREAKRQGLDDEEAKEVARAAGNKQLDAWKQKRQEERAVASLEVARANEQGELVSLEQQALAGLPGPRKSKGRAGGTATGGARAARGRAGTGLAASADAGSAVVCKEWGDDLVGSRECSSPGAT